MQRWRLVFGLPLVLLVTSCGGGGALSPRYGFAAQVVAGQADRTVEATKAAGFGWLTQQVRWDGLQPAANATIDWSQLDTAADASSRAGIKMMFSIVAAPQWAANPNSQFPKNPDDFSAFLQAMVGHFKGRVQAYEIWNEENFATEVGPGNINAGQYVELLKAAYQTIKAI
ncbi:MAG TPA: hypothetical protein VKU60_14460, partial [Chloroflexota bacterium]|nr:hypothetical protein [Chloroflexota bacterium]